MSASVTTERSRPSSDLALSFPSGSRAQVAVGVVVSHHRVRTDRNTIVRLRLQLPVWVVRPGHRPRRRTIRRRQRASGLRTEVVVLVASLDPPRIRRGLDPTIGVEVDRRPVADDLAIRGRTEVLNRSSCDGAGPTSDLAYAPCTSPEPAIPARSRSDLRRSWGSSPGSCPRRSP